MQVYGRGLRRRLAPMLGGDPERLALAFSLQLALPGTPVIWYGDEIGLGENLDLDMRAAVRCPMQWTAGPGAGFSDDDPESFVRALAKGEGFGPEAVNAADQWAEPGSLVNTVRALATLRRAAREIGRGTTRVLSPAEGGDGPLALEASWRGARTLTVHNLSASEARWTVADVEGPLYRHLSSAGVESDGAGRELVAGAEIVLPARGWLWARSVR